MIVMQTIWIIIEFTPFVDIPGASSSMDKKAIWTYRSCLTFTTIIVGTIKVQATACFVFTRKTRS